MKKRITTPHFKKWHKRKVKKCLRKRRKRRKGLIVKKSQTVYSRSKPTEFAAPEDFRLVENTEESVFFIQKLRAYTNKKGFRQDIPVRICLSRVAQVDYLTICVLIAVIENFTRRKIKLSGNLPQDKFCKGMMIESGFLNFMYAEGKQFSKHPKSESLYFKLGSGKLSEADNRLLGDTTKEIYTKLNASEKNSNGLKSILLEICGNSIEHAGSKQNTWFLGVKYEDEQVLITMTDLGSGILETLRKKITQQVFDIFISDRTILKRAFEKKYGSREKELNRNKGLPLIKLYSESKVLNNLTILTNKVLLNFENESISKDLRTNYTGTTYFFELTKQSIENYENVKYTW